MVFFFVKYVAYLNKHLFFLDAALL
jgi:hypothetical protein